MRIHEEILQGRCALWSPTLALKPLETPLAEMVIFRWGQEEKVTGFGSDQR